jgi:hypothetical protein
MLIKLHDATFLKRYFLFLLVSSLSRKAPRSRTQKSRNFSYTARKRFDVHLIRIRRRVFEEEMRNFYAGQHKVNPADWLAISDA